MAGAISFTKMHGCGNDYIYIDGAAVPVAAAEKPDLVRRLSDRHFGIGGDGVIFINPGKNADFEMEMYNQDGSRAEMCGNGIRCVGKYVYDHHLTDRTRITVESCGKVKTLTLFPGTPEEGILSAEVDMGAPVFVPELIPVSCGKAGGQAVIRQPLKVSGTEFFMTCVSMGNPHAVVFLPEGTDLERFPLEKVGPAFENHPVFPKRVNTEFVTVLSPDRVKMRVWERGSGETLACGTGCCAICAAGVLEGRTAQQITVETRGGELGVRWDREKDTIFLSGPAREVFSGTVSL